VIETSQVGLYCSVGRRIVYELFLLIGVYFYPSTCMSENIFYELLFTKVIVVRLPNNWYAIVLLVLKNTQSVGPAMLLVRSAHL